MSLQNTAQSLERNVNSPSRGGRRTLKVDSIVKMKGKDLAELALSLEIMEIEMRSQLTPARVVRWLRTPVTQSPTARPFSMLSDKVTLSESLYSWFLTPLQIAAWVVDACLQGSLSHRAQTLSKFVTLADVCIYHGTTHFISDDYYTAMPCKRKPCVFVRSSLWIAVPGNRTITGNKAIIESRGRQTS
jgi:hypothetical protein